MEGKVEKTQSIVNLVKALIKAQQGFAALEKSKTAKYASSTYLYADLDDMKKATMPSLEKNGLTLNFFPSNINGVPHLEALLVHESGEYIQSRYPITPDKAGLQGVGAAFTYLKRYFWGSILSLYEDENDDNFSEPGEAPIKKTTQKEVNFVEEKINERQLSELRKELTGQKALFEQILSDCSIEKITDLPSKKFDYIMGYVKQEKIDKKLVGV